MLVIATTARKHYRESLTRGILVTATCLGFARCCGLGRELVMAARSGPSEATDAVYAALTFVTMMMTVLSMTLPYVFARVFYAHATEPVERHRRIWVCLVRWAGILGLASAAMLIFPDALLSLLAHSGSAEFRSQGVLALRLGAPILFLQGMFLPLAAVGNSEGWHTPVALLSTGFPLGGLLGVLAFHQWLGPSSLLLGIIVASAVQVCLLVGSFWARGMTVGGIFALDEVRMFRELLWVAAPVALGAALLKLDTVLMVRFASELRPGDVFLLAIAGMLVNVPMSVANQAVSQTTVPDLVRSFARGEGERFGRIVLMTSELTTLLIVPCAVLMVVDAGGVMGLLFQRGRFTADAGARTAAILCLWAAASPLLSLNYFLEEVLMARGIRVGVAVGRGASVILIGIACWWGAHRGGLAGMVGAFVGVSAMRNVVMIELVTRLASIPRAIFCMRQVKVLAAGLVAAASANLVGGAVDRIPLGVLPRIALEGTAIVAIMFVVCFVLGVESVSRGIDRGRSALAVPSRRAKAIPTVSIESVAELECT